jgi:hypothetical protein
LFRRLRGSRDQAIHCDAKRGQPAEGTRTIDKKVQDFKRRTGRLRGRTRQGLAIALWFRRAQGKKRVEGPLCLGCDREFGPGRHKPEAFCIAQPYYELEPTNVVCTGICRRCARRTNDELMATAAQGLIGKSTEPVDEGHA